MAEDFNPRTELSYKESEFDKVIRPQNFDQFSGQDKVLDNLKVFVKARSEEHTSELQSR